MSREKKTGIEINCRFCGKLVMKQVKYFNSATKKNRPMFCNNTCATTYHNSTGIYKNNGDLSNFGSLGKHKPDEFTPFRFYIKKATRRKTGLTVQDVKYLWEKQGGICALSGLPIKLRNEHGTNDIFTTASLDRIDSSKPYVVGNIQFVILSLNLAKQSSTNEEFLNFLSRLRG